MVLHVAGGEGCTTERITIGLMSTLSQNIVGTYDSFVVADIQDVW